MTTSPVVQFVLKVEVLSIPPRGANSLLVHSRAAISPHDGSVNFIQHRWTQNHNSTNH